MKPTDPIMEGHEFQGWYTSDGKEYDFEQIVTKSDILYAKWSGDGGVTFLASEMVEETAVNTTHIIFGVGAFLLLAGWGICIWMIRKGMKHGRK